MAQSNVEIIRSGYQAFSRGDIESVLAIMDRNVDWNVPQQIGGRIQGVDRVGNFFQTLGQRYFAELRVEPQTYVAEGDHVVVIGRHRGLTRETKKTLETPFAHVWTLRDGKVISMQEFTDTAALASALTPARAGVTT